MQRNPTACGLRLDKPYLSCLLRCVVMTWQLLPHLYRPSRLNTGSPSEGAKLSFLTIECKYCIASYLIRPITGLSAIPSSPSHIRVLLAQDAVATAETKLESRCAPKNCFNPKPCGSHGVRRPYNGSGWDERDPSALSPSEDVTFMTCCSCATTQALPLWTEVMLPSSCQGRG